MNRCGDLHLIAHRAHWVVRPKDSRCGDWHFTAHCAHWAVRPKDRPKDRLFHYLRGNEHR